MTVTNSPIKAPNLRATRFVAFDAMRRWWLTALIVLSYLTLALQPDLRAAIPLLVGVTALVTLLIAVCLYDGGRNRWHCTPGLAIGVAILLRAMFVFRPAELSDDIFRYLWDGLILLGGRNPYALPPGLAAPPDGLPTGLLALVNHPHLTTIYPPAAQLVFAAGASLKAGVLGIKALLVAIDLLTCVLLMRLLENLRKPAWRVVAYAWHPLPVLEIAASGHIDGAATLFVVLAIYLLCLPSATGQILSPDRASQYRAVASGLALAMAVLIKLFPLVFFPGLMILAGRSRWHYVCLGAAGAALLLVLPFLPDLRHAWASLALYALTWEFSGFVYRLLSSTPLSGIGARWLLGLVYTAVMIMGYRSVGLRGISTARLLRVFRFLGLAFILLTPTVHPWYALYLVLFLPFSPGPGALVLSWSVLLAYRVWIPYTLLGAWAEDDLTALMIFAGPVAAGCLALLGRRHHAGGSPSLDPG